MPLSGENMIANFLIGLREGLEAALIVGILAGYLVKIGRREDFSKLFTGVGSAVALSVLVGFGLTLAASETPAGVSEIIAGTMSIVAVGFVTWMIFWMALQAKSLGSELRGKIDQALKVSTVTLVGVAFFAVIREGIETAVFLWSAAKATGDETYPLLGATLGLLVASAMGYLIYRGVLKFNLSSFFKYTGAFLIVVAAGILAYGVHELQEIGAFAQLEQVLPILTSNAYDVSAIIEKDGVLHSILKGTISFRVAPSNLEALVWFLYAIPVTFIYVRGYRRPVASKA
jgi:high-affinity iron transporter